MNYKELYEYEHKKLPLLLLGRKEGIDIILGNFIDFSINFVPSCKGKKFRIVKNDYVQRNIDSFLEDDDIVIMFSFPLEENDNYIGLAKYGFFVYKKKYLEKRYYLLEMFKHNNGFEDVYWYYLVEYRLTNILSDGYEFEKRVYPNKIWLGDESQDNIKDL